MSEEVNGWKNAETWTFMLWTNNDQGDQEFAHEVVRGVLAREDDVADSWVGSRVIDETKDRLLEAIEAWPSFDNMAPVTGSHAFLFLTDVGSWDRIDPQEVGEALVRDVREIDG